MPPRKKTTTPLERLTADLKEVAPDAIDTCAVHLATIAELTALLDAADADSPPNATYFQRRTEAANFVARLIEERKSEGRAETERNEAADRVIAAIRGEEA